MTLAVNIGLAETYFQVQDDEVDDGRGRLRGRGG